MGGARIPQRRAEWADPVLATALRQNMSASFLLGARPGGQWLRRPEQKILPFEKMPETMSTACLSIFPMRPAAVPIPLVVKPMMAGPPK